MIQIEFTSAEINNLHYERFHYPAPRVQLKMEALYLKSQGLPSWNNSIIVQDLFRYTR